MKLFNIIILLVSAYFLNAEILIPMDTTQENHLKAYGIAFNALENNNIVKWLLNYRGGSYIINESEEIIKLCHLRGVSYEIINSTKIKEILNYMTSENMDEITLETPPKIAVYTPPNKQPWDDAVTLALTYAEIPYETIWDKEVLNDKLNEYDWLHLHHEDFTGQYGKFFSSYRNADWYKEEVSRNQQLADNLGFDKVWKMKHAVVNKIKKYIVNGGFLFAMCAATDTFDIALAANNIDIVDTLLDKDPIDKDYASKLNFNNTLAFKDFTIITDPLEYEFSSIDASDYAKIRGAEADYFSLFDFSAKYDPVPTMLTQSHNKIINGFLGQTTSFHKKFLKESVIILGEVPQNEEAKYIHGNYGKGTFTFYGGHDPEDYQHRIGDPETRLELHKNSPGYRLILNNILFPAAEKKKLKT